MDYLGFLIGQATVVLVFWARWKVPGSPWSAYWKNGHLPQHITDLCLSIFAFVAWQTGLLIQFADLVGVGELARKFPETQSGMAVAFLMGGALAWGTWFLVGKKKE